MKQDLTGSSISVPIPTELYVALLGTLRARGNRMDPVATIVAFIRKQLAETKTDGSPEVAESTVGDEWSDDWISFQSPPCADRTTQTASTSKNSGIGQGDHSGWCIGCGCPSPEIME